MKNTTPTEDYLAAIMKELARIRISKGISPTELANSNWSTPEGKRAHLTLKRYPGPHRFS